MKQQCLSLVKQSAHIFREIACFVHLPGLCKWLNEDWAGQHTSGSITQPKLHSSLGCQRSIQESPPIGIKILLWATQGSDTKTLRSPLLLRYLQPDSMIPVIHGFDYAVWLSSRSKCCNALISMLVVMNSDGYLCMTILQSSGVIWAVTRIS